jgi:(1->4)-alpha-D-glucan 1-alpha-D-glucosylmutase
VRARLALLSEIPEAWGDACGRWLAASAPHWPGGEPDRHAQHLLFQTLVGAWPLSPDRAVAYLAKATREAKQRTSWLSPDEPYEQARDAWVKATLADDPLMAEVEAFVLPLLAPSRANALAQALLQLTSPGVPDTYQGTELWDLSLVDPDNRRPVDFALRGRLLADLAAAGPAGPAAGHAGRLEDPGDDGLAKLALVRAALHLRRRRPGVFGAGPGGAYASLMLHGPAAGHGVAFARGASPGEVAVVVPRLVLGLGTRAGGWDGTTLALPAGHWADLLTGATHDGSRPVPVADLLAGFPVALLERA